MGIKYYRLNTNLYEPYWTIDESIVPYDHIETIVKTLENFTGNTGWIECTNVEWSNIANITARGTIDTLPTYLKVDANGEIYYYYLLNRNVVDSSKNNETYYVGTYQLDNYMTIYHHKLFDILLAEDPMVLVNRGFDNRWYTKVDGEQYTIDFIKQRYLSNTIDDNSNMMVRNYVYSTNADTLWSLNFTVDIPTDITFTQYGGTSTITHTYTELTATNSRGRYEYIICKPSSIMRCSNKSLLKSYTKQQFIVIPLISGLEDTILHGLNDIDITSDHEYVLDPFGDNQIGLYECDVPFSMFAGWNLSSKYGVTNNYLVNVATKGTTTENVTIPFFMVNNNAPILFKIINYTDYSEGMYGKFLTFVNNIGTWTPDTEPALWNPTYYKEVYNNGNSNLVSDASRFVFKWTKDAITPMGVQAYLSFSDNLNIAYNYGDFTNTSLATLDNTESVDGNLSLANMYFGSASANYFTQNATTTATGIQVRKSEQSQAWYDAALDSTKAIAGAIKPSRHLIPWRIAMDYTSQALTATVSVAKVLGDTMATQQRANAQFRSSINNLMSSPSPTISNGSTKAVIPNKVGLFDTYGIELHPNDKKLKFNDYCNNGYVCNEVKNLSKVFNRKIMNILNIDTTHNQEDLRRILWWDNEKVFNTPYWNQQFLAWMNESHKIYNTWWLLNCTDYYSPYYVSNIENELPVVPSAKTNIETLITVFRDTYEAGSLLETLQTDNTNAPTDLWDDIEIVNVDYAHFVIKAKESSSKYFGYILHLAICYNATVTLTSGELKYIYDFNKVCCSSDAIWKFEDGTTWSGQVTANNPFVFNTNSSITTIKQFFMARKNIFCDISLPSNITKIEGQFFYNTRNMNAITITIPKAVTSIGDEFMWKCDSWTGTIVMNANPTCLSTKFPEYHLATDEEDAACYKNGITVSGTYASELKTLLPNMDTYKGRAFYRKLI